MRSHHDRSAVAVLKRAVVTAGLQVNDSALSSNAPNHHGANAPVTPAPTKLFTPGESSVPTVDGRDAWVAGYDVAPADPTADGGTVHAVVVEDGDRLVYALILAGADPAVLEQARAAVDSIRFA